MIASVPPTACCAALDSNGAEPADDTENEPAGRAEPPRSFEHPSSTINPSAAPMDDNRNRRRLIPSRRATASDSSRVRRIASRTNALAGGGTNSPFELGASLIGRPGSVSSRRAMREGTSMDIEGAVDFMRSNHGAVLHTFRHDGGPQLSPVTVGVDGE